MKSSLPRMLLLANLLAFMFVCWSYWACRSEWDTLGQSAARLRQCQQLIAGIESNKALATEAIIAGDGYQPETDVMKAASAIGLTIDDSFSISHGSPQPVEGTRLAVIPVQLSPLELTMEQVFKLVCALSRCPTPMNVRRISLVRTEPRGAAAAGNTERWVTNLDIYYLAHPAETAPQ